MMSALRSSAIQPMATEVSSPPLYARTMRSFMRFSLCWSWLEPDGDIRTVASPTGTAECGSSPVRARSAAASSSSATVAPPSGSRVTSSTVSSPAMVPITVLSRLWSIEDARKCAPPGGVRRTTRLPEWSADTRSSARRRTMRSMAACSSSDATEARATTLRWHRVDQVPVGGADPHGTELVEVAGQGRLGHRRRRRRRAAGPARTASGPRGDPGARRSAADAPPWCGAGSCATSSSRVARSTRVPTPASVKTSSSRACGTRPSRTCARSTPPSTADRHAVIFGIIPAWRVGTIVRSSDALISLITDDVVGPVGVQPGTSVSTTSLSRRQLHGKRRGCGVGIEVVREPVLATGHARDHGDQAVVEDRAHEAVVDGHELADLAEVHLFPVVSDDTPCAR